MSSVGAFSLILYVTCLADATLVRPIALRWLRRVIHREDASAEDLPPILVLQVSALPLGALVEVQLEASDPSAKSIFRQSWATTSDGICKAYCDAAVAGPTRDPARRTSVNQTSAELDDAREGHVSYGLLSCALRAKTGIIPTTKQWGCAVADALVELESRLFQVGLRINANIYARALFDEKTGLHAAEMAEKIGAAVSTVGSWNCSSFALPVVRVIAPVDQVRVAVHVHYTTRPFIETTSE